MTTRTTVGCVLVISTVMTLSLYYYGDNLKTYSLGQLHKYTIEYKTRYPIPYRRADHTNQSRNEQTFLPNELFQELEPRIDDYLENSTDNVSITYLKTRYPISFSRADHTNQSRNEPTLLPNEWFQELEPRIDEYLENSTDNYWIVVWDPPFGNRGHEGAKAGGPKCGKCTLTYDRSKITAEKPGAVVFHFNELRKNNMPPIRYPNQLYAFWTMEGPRALLQLRGMSLKEYDGVFNLTMTYRRDADIQSPYNQDVELLSQIKIAPEDFESRTQEIISKKKGLALWIVSNCGSHALPGGWHRIGVSNQLVEAGLYIERKGACFGGRDNSFKPIDYKFYLSFENQHHCKDYITEKLWNNAYNNDAVPIVWGATKEDYEAVAPPNSFIFAEDYTRKELADYVNYLHHNDTAYAEYFRWRTMKPEEMAGYGKTRGFCQLCRTLHGINVDNIYNPNYEEKYKDIPLFGYPERPRIVTSLHDWFYLEDNEECIK